MSSFVSTSRRSPVVDAAWRDGSLVLTVDLPGTPGDAVHVSVAGRTLLVRPEDASDTDTVAAIVAELTGETPTVDRSTFTVTAAAAHSALLPAAVRRLDDAGIAIAELGLRQASLDDVFLTLTGHTADSDGADSDGADSDGADSDRADSDRADSETAEEAA